jgi:type II secretory pathway component PulF
MAVIFVGGVIGSCIVALFLPLVSLINSVSGGM